MVVVAKVQPGNIKQTVDCELLNNLQLSSLINVLIKCSPNYTKITIINKLINQTLAKYILYRNDHTSRGGVSTKVTFFFYIDTLPYWQALAKLQLHLKQEQYLCLPSTPFLIVLNLRNPNLRSAHTNFMQQCAYQLPVVRSEQVRIFFFIVLNLRKPNLRSSLS